jgi:glycyl-tRNA synthetase beta chain
VNLVEMVEHAYRPHSAHNADAGWEPLTVGQFLWERHQHLLERRGFKGDEIRVLDALDKPWSYPRAALQRVDALSKVRSSADFQALASLFKRVKNITKNVDDAGESLDETRAMLKEPAELALADELGRRLPTIDGAMKSGDYVKAMQELGSIYPAVDRFFTDVLVMAEEPSLRRARLALLTRLRSVVLDNIGDISEIAAEDGRSG